MKHRDLILAFLGALMLAVSRLPLHLGWLVFFGWIPYLHLFERGVSKPIQMLKIGFITSLVYVLIVFYWFGIVTIPGLIGMVFLYALVYFLFFSAIQRIYRTYPLLRYLGFIPIMLSFEYIQNFGETRFPWFNIAYSLADYNLLIQISDLIGVVGLSALVLIINVLIYTLLPISQKWLHSRSNYGANTLHPFRKRQIAAGSAILLILVAWGGYGYLALRNIELIEHDAGIFVMQPSINQDVKWEPEQYHVSMEVFRDLTMQAVADSAKLVIYPEGAITEYLMHSTSAQADLKAILDSAKVDIFTGFPDWVPAPEEHVNPVLSYNAASLFQPDDFSHELYYKNILVPVGERMLWLDQFPFLWKLQFGQANWEFGTKLAYYTSGGFTFSPSICYELAFPDIFHRMAIPQNPETGVYNKCDYLVNITNDGWFGTSYGPWLHAAMVRFRAVENRIQIYRSANTGISMIVDPKGRIITQTKLFEIKNITAPLYTTPKVPPIRKIHRYPLIFVAIGLLCTGLSLFKKTERQP